MKTDFELRRDVEAALAWEPYVDTTWIGVSVNDGIVLLSGHVASFSEKWAAEDVVKNVVGVKGVANDIAVKLPNIYTRLDTEIAEMAISVLTWDILVPSEKIKITVNNGWITLEGEVDWQFQRKAAESDVRNLTGVVGVTNLITIKAQERVEDVKARIDAAVRRLAGQDAQHILIEERDGKVVLSGQVHSPLIRSKIEQNVWAAPGITDVENKITVTA